MDSRLLYHHVMASRRLGGAETLAIEIHKYAISKRTGSSELLVPPGGSTRKLAESEGLLHRTYQLDWAQERDYLRSLFANLDLYLKLSRSSRGLLHIHCPFVFGALRPLLSVSRHRTILHLHLDYAEEQLRWALKRTPDSVIVCAQFMEERVWRLLPTGRKRKTRVVVAMNAIDLDRFTQGDRSQAKQQFGIDPGRPVLLMAANLAPHKGQHTAIRATAMLVDRGYRPLLWLVGEERDMAGDYAKQLQSRVGDLGLSEFIEFLGFRNDVPRLLRAADYFLLPSTQEGLPLAILEAQASKVVVLAAPTAGVPEIVEDGRTGFLIDANNPKGYADIVTSLLDNRKLADAVTERAHRQVTSSFSLSKYCESMLAEYDALLREP